MIDNNLAIDLSQRLTDKFLHHSVINKYLNSIEELRELTSFESIHLVDFFSLKDFELQEKFTNIGKDLFVKYNVSIEDILIILQFIEEELIIASNHKLINMELPHILKRAKIVKQSLAKGFFSGMLNNIEKFLNFNKEKSNSVLSIHKEWFITLIHYLNHKTDIVPNLDHITCKFAPWLESMEFQLYVHGLNLKKDETQASIFFAHRSIHEEASHIISFCKKEDYILAVSHLSRLFEQSLLLEDYIRFVKIEYMNNPDKNFFSFIEYKTKFEKELYYFASLLIQNNNLVDIKQFLHENFELLTDTINSISKDFGFDTIFLINDEAIHLLVKYSNDTNMASIIDFIENNLHPEIKKIALNLKYTIKTIGLKVDNLYQMCTDLSNILPNIKHYESLKEVLLLDDDGIKAIFDIYTKNNFIRDEINKAFEENLFEIFFQPIVNGKEKKGTLLVETLVRLPHKGSFLSADNFLFAIENDHQMLKLDLYVLRKLKKTISKLVHTVSRVSVNVYPSSFESKELFEEIKLLAKEFEKNSIKLIVEITEQTLLSSVNPLKDLAQNYGIVFAIDDFGTGYSNFVQLVEMSDLGIVQVMKIDGSLVKGIEQNLNKLNIITILCQMAVSLGLEPVILEYVENEEILHKLQSLPGDILFQGFYFDKALSLEQLITKYGSNN